MLTALVIGDANSIDADTAAAFKLFTPDVICATNNMGIRWPARLDYWCTLHPEPCKDWVGIVEAMRQRRAAGRNRPQVWGHKVAPGIDRRTDDWNGSTGLLCAKVMREEGFERIVLAGVPLSAEGGHYYDKRVWTQANRYHIGWTRHLAEIAPYVRSLGGWTRELLGEPTADWIAGQPA